MAVLLIFTHQITPRVTYITRQLFTRMLGIELQLTTKVEDFIAHKGPKITYTRQPLQNEFFIRSHELLFQHGVDEVEVQIGQWDHLPCFFRAGERSNIPYDILAASFYLITRYEEYLPHVKDVHGRYPPGESIAAQAGCLRQPLVDQWVYKLLAALQERFPDLKARPEPYRFVPVVDVTTSHCYALRGGLRSLGGMLYDLSRFRMRRVWERIRVWFRPSLDPYDNYDRLIALHKEVPVEAMYFFQFAEYSTYDKNVSTNNNKFRHLIKSVADYSVVSLSVSYTGARDTRVMKEEKKRLAEVLNRPVSYSRLRYNRVEIPQTYRDLVEAEFKEDYTMGYSYDLGFRAGTCTPYFFYDLALESQQPIRIVPFALHDYALLRLESPRARWEAMDQLYRSVKEVNGTLVCIFSNELLGGHQTEDWMALYAEVLKKYHA
ncbi:polysaccharide deacetylase family protein [Robiginitalea sp. M366]|uniref:polysaccharide deacetylase family protein n=1 Tax=Robiginitalea aestuariiviva TaxID=3036903 RepID=UPI00240D9406|nr:polysaccharide deacetylase family protein [Robiginitalea aestuariiviva]MDG1572082.1 polysaccharide deacetylase family protein [Robiginitalea aestuariiviva]